MKTIVTFIAVVALISVCSADSAPPHEVDLISSVGNLDIKADQWTLSKGVLSKNTPLSHGDNLLVVKEEVVKVPDWYSLRCTLVNIQQLNDKLPAAGVVFGFVDGNSYWSLMIDEELSHPILKLVQMKEGKTVTETSVPLTMETERKEIAISVEVHHQLFVKAYANKVLVLTHNVSNGIERGRVGLALQSGLCGFSNVSISGISKR